MRKNEEDGLFWNFWGLPVGNRVCTNSHRAGSGPRPGLFLYPCPGPGIFLPSWVFPWPGFFLDYRPWVFLNYRPRIWPRFFKYLEHYWLTINPNTSSNLITYLLPTLKNFERSLLPHFFSGPVKATFTHFSTYINFNFLAFTYWPQSI